MSDKGYKEYFENRTVADIMTEYSEQHDEWEIPSKKKNEQLYLKQKCSLKTLLERKEISTEQYVERLRALGEKLNVIGDELQKAGGTL